MLPVALVVGSLAMVTPAHAALCRVEVGPNQFKFEECTPGSTGNPGSETPSQPSCVLGPGDNICAGPESCYEEESIEDPDVMVELGIMPPRPGPDYIIMWSTCSARLGYRWVQQAAPTPGQLAQQALGTLPFPQASVGVSPPHLSLVNLDTWWWAQGVSMQVLSSSAGTVTVTATPRSLQVDPGDGSKVKTCPVVVTESDTCSTTYRRASPADGYPVRVRVVWDLAFTDNGAPSTFPGLPTQFTGQWAERQLPVREVQTKVSRIG